MAAKKPKKSTKRAPAAKKPGAQQTNLYLKFYREIWAVICLVLALLVIFSALAKDSAFARFFSGLFGQAGLIALPIGLGLCFVALMFHSGRPVLMRILCSLASVVLICAIAHLICNAAKPEGVSFVKWLYDAGKIGQSGGVIGGAVASFIERLLGHVGAYIPLFLLLLVTLPASVNLTLTGLLRALNQKREEREKERKEQNIEPEPYIEPAQVLVNHISERHAQHVEKKKNRERFEYDLPVDGVADAKKPLKPQAPAQVPAEAPKPVQTDGGIESLDGPELLLSAKGQRLPGREAQKADRRPPLFRDNRPAPEPAPDPIPEPVRPAPPEPPVVPVVDPMPEPPAPPPVEPPVPPVKEPQQEKVKPEEARKAAAEVAKEIAAVQEEPKEEYVYPPVSLLKPGKGPNGDGTEEMRENTKRLKETLDCFNVDAEIINVIRGPSVTMYELELAQGVRLNRLTGLADDIALALGASGVRISAIPDKISVVGIEVPNKLVSVVPVREVIDSSAFRSATSRISFAVGKDISGNCIVGDIARLPHLLIAGTTGSGKSVCMNSLITSLLFKAKPEEVRLIMVDPKMVELGNYNGIPHLLIPVVTDPKKAAGALQWTVTEMLRRYRLMSEAGVRDLESYNRFAATAEDFDIMPQIVVVIDELADLMLVAAKEVEESICRIAQMGRASGIHLVIATQRPSADVITGLMKANIPSRIAFAVSSAMESRIILDNTGAEKLVGKGDMLFAPLGKGKPKRVQGCLISDEEVQAVVDFVKNHSSANYSEEVQQQIELRAAEQGNKRHAESVAEPAPETASGDGDELLPAAVEVILETKQASVSMLQRRLKLGYARAARIVDEMEEKGIVGPFEGSKPRQLLITKEQWQAMQGGEQLVISEPEATEEPSEEE